MRPAKADVDVSYTELRDACTLGELVQFHLVCDMEAYKQARQTDKMEKKRRSDRT